MRLRWSLGLLGAVLIVYLGIIGMLARAESLAVLPVRFIQNEGQYPVEVRYAAEGPGFAAWFLDDSIWLAYPSPRTPDSPAQAPPQVWNIRLALPLRGEADIAAGAPIPISRSFLTPDGWFESVPVFDGLSYHGLQDGVVLQARQVGGQLELAFHAAPDAPEIVDIELSGVDGLEVREGRLFAKLGEAETALPFVVDTPGLRIRARTPAGDQVELTPAAGQVSRSPDTPLDGTLVYGTYYGNSGALETGTQIVVDADGYAYISGSTNAPAVFAPYTGLRDPQHLSSAFILKLNPTGTAADFILSITGSDANGGDYAHAITLDSDKNIYVTGMTSSNDFPTTTGAYDQTPNGGMDAWLIKLNSNGTLNFSTVIGSAGQEWANAVKTGLFNQIYITGFTNHPSFPTTANAFDTSHNGGYDAFIAIFNNQGSALLRSSFLGGSADEGGVYGQDRSDLHVDSVGNAFVIGPTKSANFPQNKPIMGSGGCQDIFLTKLNPELQSFYFSTRIGGSGSNCAINGNDHPERVYIDRNGNIYISGSTTTQNGFGFPVTAGAFDTTQNGGADGFLLKINPTTITVRYGTFIGGSALDSANDIVVDTDQKIILTGLTSSGNFPVSANAFDLSLSGPSDAFVFKLTPLDSGGGDLEYATFFGGSGPDRGVDLALLGKDVVYLTGSTSSVNFPISAGSLQDTYSGNQDAFIALFHLLNPSPPHPKPTWTPAPFYINLPVANFRVP